MVDTYCYREWDNLIVYISTSIYIPLGTHSIASQYIGVIDKTSGKCWDFEKLFPSSEKSNKTNIKTCFSTVAKQSLWVF